MALNLDVLSAALDSFLPPGGPSRPVRRRGASESPEMQQHRHQSSVSLSQPATKAPSVARSGSVGRPPIAPSPSPPSSMGTAAIVNKLAMALDHHVHGIQGRGGRGQSPSTSGRSASTEDRRQTQSHLRAGPSPRQGRQEGTRSISVGGSLSPNSVRASKLRKVKEAPTVATGSIDVNTVRAHHELFGNKAQHSHAAEADRRVTVYGQSVITAVQHATGSGAQKVTQLFESQPSLEAVHATRQVTPQGVWSTNPIREEAGAVAVLALHMPSLRLRTETDTTRLVKTETVKDLMLHIVTDQIPSAGAALLVASSHHPSTGFVTIAKQAPFMQTSAASPGQALQECVLLVKGSLVAPYLRVTITPKRDLMSTIRISYLSVMAATTASSREVSMEPTAVAMLAMHSSPSPARQVMRSVAEHHADEPPEVFSPPPANPSLSVYVDHHHHHQPDVNYFSSAPVPHPEPVPNPPPVQQPSIYAPPPQLRSELSTPPASTRVNQRRSDDALDVVLSPNTPKTGGGGGGSANPSNANTPTSSSYWLSGSPPPVAPVHASARLAEILFSTVKADATAISKAVQSASATEVNELLAAMRSRSESRQRGGSVHRSREEVEGKSPTAEALERSRRRRREAALAAEEADRQERATTLARQLIADISREGVDVPPADEADILRFLENTLPDKGPRPTIEAGSNPQSARSSARQARRRSDPMVSYKAPAYSNHQEPPSLMPTPAPTPQPSPHRGSPKEQPHNHKDPTEALMAKISQLQASFEALSRQVAEGEERAIQRGEQKKEAAAEDSKHQQNSSVAQAPSSPVKDVTHSRHKALWDELPTAGAFPDLLMAGIRVSNHHGEAKNGATISVCLQPTPPPLSKSEGDAPGGATFTAKDMAGYITMPYKHFIIAMNDDLSTPSASLYPAFECFIAALLALKESQRGSPVPEPLARSRIGFVVRVGKQTFTITTLHGYRLLDELQSFNTAPRGRTQRPPSPFPMPFGAGNPNRVHVERENHSHRHVTIKVAAWLDFPSRGFEVLLEPILSMNTSGPEMPSSTSLTYFAAVSDSELQTALGNGEAASELHPLLAFVDFSETHSDPYAMVRKSTTPTTISIPLTVWAGHAIQGSVEDGVLTATFVPHVPREWVLLTGRADINHLDESGDGEPVVDHEAEDSMEEMGKRISLRIRTGHILDSLVAWDESDVHDTPGAAVTTSQLGRLRRIAGKSFVSRALAAGRLLIIPSMADTGTPSLCSSALHSMVMALDNKWSSVALWVEEGRDGPQDLRQLITALGQWGYKHPTRIILYIASGTSERSLAKLGFTEVS